MAAAERGRQADPSACGTCRSNVEAGGQVEHDECAQRATLLPAPDAPGYELITGMSEEEVHALPARFHIPVFMESSSPRMWVCAVCWGEGWVARWPCKTAVDQGLRVFTADDYAEAAAKRQATELAAYRALELGAPDGRLSAACDNPEHPTWLRKPDDIRGCPWCQCAQLDKALGDTIDDRDRTEEAADKLAYAVAPIEVIGEHSSESDPWENALDHLTSAADVAKLRAELAGARVQAIRDLADKADPQHPEVSFFGDHGHEVGAWMLKQAEYEQRRLAPVSEDTLPAWLVRLDDLHRAKIRLADEVLVVGPYIGNSTRAEIAYARELGKPVRFTHPEVDPAVSAA